MNPLLLISLPLLGKELIDLSVHARTYLIRFVYAIAVVVVGLLQWEYGVAGRMPISVLGFGVHIMHVLTDMQQLGMQVVLPAFCCGVFTIEKERGTLGLLFLTRLGPWTIVFEKMLSRLFMAWSFLIISLPMLAFCYALGGITVETLLQQVVYLVLMSIAVTSGSVLCSAYFRTTYGALAASYLLMYASRMLLHCGAWESLSGTSPTPYLGEILVMRQQAPWGFSAGQSIAIVSSIWLTYSMLCLVGARHFLVTRAFLPPRTRKRGVMHWMDRIFQRANQNRVTQNVLLPDLFGANLNQKPIAWRELISPGILGTPSGRWRLFIALETMSLGFVILFNYAESPEVGRGVTIFIQTVLWIVMVLLTCLCSASLITSERQRQTFDSLLVLPIASRDIILQKMASVSQLIWIFSIPIATCLMSRLLIQNEFISVLCHLSMLAIYPGLVAWIGMWHSLTSPSTLTAAIRSLGDVLLRVFAPLYLMMMIQPDTGMPGATESYELMHLISPATLYVYVEMQPSTFARLPLLILVINAVFYVTIMVTIRARCLNRANELLGRVAEPD